MRHRNARRRRAQHQRNAPVPFKLAPTAQFPWSLVKWTTAYVTVRPHRYYATRADAVRAAPGDGRPWTVVDVLRKPRYPLPTVVEILSGTYVHGVRSRATDEPADEPADDELDDEDDE